MSTAAWGTVQMMPHDDERRRLALATIALMDVTDLNDARRGDGLDQLMRDAFEHRTAAVCVWPQFVARCVEATRAERPQQSRSDVRPESRPEVRVATVANFPNGDASITDVLAEVASSLLDGADEIDVVLPYRAVQLGDLGRAGTMVSEVADLVHDRSERLLKVILETGELVDPGAIRAAAECAVGHGADFIKTSTGKTPVSATLEAVEVMLDVIAEADRPVGVKPSGGIRTLADASSYLDLAASRFGAEWASPATFRFGASALLADAVRAVEEAAG